MNSFYSKQRNRRYLRDQQDLKEIAKTKDKSPANAMTKLTIFDELSNEKVETNFIQSGNYRTAT